MPVHRRLEACVIGLLSACQPTTAPPEATAEPSWAAWCPADARAVDARVEALIAGLSLDEATALLAGTSLLPGADGLWHAPGAGTLPPMALLDGPRGVSKSTGPATAFPVGAARGATWDPELEGAVGAAIATEARAVGVDVLLAPTINVLRHPRWGRAQETYGEDPHHLAGMGVAFVKGAQGAGIIASAKHYAANSIEDTRFDVDVRIDEASLREVYLPAFRAVVQDAGVGSVMSAYNKVNGAHSAESLHLIRDILKEEWGFSGFVESDWVFGTESTVASLQAGLDLEMPVGVYYGEALAEAVRAGAVDRALVDDAVARLARTRWCFDVEAPRPEVDACAAAPLALTVAEDSAVLLKNESAVPLAPEASIALLGRLADRENLGDVGSSDVEACWVVTPLEGLREAGVNVTHLEEWTPQSLATYDVAVVVVGLTAADEGEGFIAAGDRSSLALPQEDLDLIAAITAIHPQVVVVLQGGSVLDVEPFIEDIEALWMTWYPGMEGGTALAGLLTGRVPPTGRLPVTWPRREADLPLFDNTSLTVTYDGWHGYRHLDREGIEPRFPFGYGLSTTEFVLQDATWKDADTVRVTVANTGPREGRATVQAYASAGSEAPARELVGWVQLEVAAGEVATALLTVSSEPVSTWNGQALVPPSGSRTLELGWHAGDVQTTLAWE